MRIKREYPNITLFCPVLVTAALLVGCSSEPKLQGDGLVLAKYSMRTLSSDLGADIRVPALMAAAELALTDRGYSVTSTSTTEDAGRVEAKPPGAGNR